MLGGFWRVNKIKTDEILRVIRRHYMKTVAVIRLDSG